MNNNGRKQLEAINQQIKEMVGIYRGAVVNSGIAENEYWIWYTLIVMDGEYTQQDICEAWSLSKQTVNSIITHLIKDDYVTLEVIPGSRNKKIIRMTEEGRKHGEAIVKPISAAEERAIDRLPEEDRIACMNVLGKFIQVLKEEISNVQ